MNARHGWCTLYFAISLVADVRPAAATPTAEAAQPEAASAAEASLFSCSTASRDVVVSFRPGVTLSELVTWAMGFSCENFIYSSQIASLKSSVHLIAPSSMSPKEAWRTFLVALRAMKLTLVKRSGVYEIVEAAQAARDAVPILNGKAPPATEQIHRLVVRPEHVSVEELSTVFQALSSSSGSVAPLPGSGLLLVTDHGSHIARMGELLQVIDLPRPDQHLYAIRVRYADVVEMVELIRGLLDADASPTRPLAGTKKGSKAAKPRATRAGAGGSSGTRSTPSQIVADPRTQTIIMLASKSGYERAKALVSRLDSEISSDGSSRVHLLPLQHADAELTATTLQTLIGGQTQGAKQPGERPTAASVAGARIEGQVRVTHDAETNSLLLMASVRDFVAMREIVRDLDQPRQQVLIEATILEISMSDSSQLGLSLHGGKQTDDGAIWLTGLQHDDLRTLPNVKSNLALTGALGGVIGKPLPGIESLLGQTIPSFSVLFHALARSSQVNILSSPQLMTSNNKEAKLSVGQNVPYAAAISAPTSSDPTQGPVQSVQRENVDLTLKVTPHVNASSMVRLDIDLDIRELLPNQEALQPSWTTRKVVNTVVVRDQESIIIGGLVAEKTAKSHSKVPLLGDIPIIGRLFRRSRDESVKTSLLILLTPHVVSSPRETARLTRKHLAQRDEFLRSFTAFSRRRFRPGLDYAKRRGIIAEIGAQVGRSEHEAAQIEALELELNQVEDGLLLPAEHSTAQ